MEAGDLSHRVASFSCYLNHPEDNSIVQKIWPGSSNVKISKTNVVADGGLRVNNNFTFNAASPMPVQDPTVAFILPHPHIANNNPKPSKKVDTEVSIFKADRYFSTTSDYTTVPRAIKYTNVLQGQEGHFKSGTPSVCSESSGSLSSQMALLPNIIKQKKGIIGRRLLLGFGCRGPCSDKKAIFIKQNPGNILREENSIIEELPRKSLEVFGADKVVTKGGVAVNLERKLSMLTWDAIPSNAKNSNPPMTPTTTISNTICDDRASDASSDLFEIENISTSTGYGYFAASQQTADYTSACSSPTQYEPSEASIQWTVVTASAADYAASVVSDYCVDEIHTTVKAKNTGSTKSTSKTRAGGLLGCKSHKAVSVAQSVSKTTYQK